MYLNFKAETKTCYRYERCVEGQLETLYLKKETIKELGLNPEKGITLTLQEGDTDA